MKKLIFLFFILAVFIVACTPQIPEVNDSESTQNNGRLASPTWCQIDEDCVCGGIDMNTGDCFVGNRAYYETNVDTSRDCPDFCTGIANHLVTKCVNNVCQNVVRDDFNKPEPVFCTADAKLCPDGSAVGRVGPNCEFAPCPESTPPSAPDDLSAAHWQCEDGSWKNNPEDCFENTCITKADCQLMGVKGVCGPYLIAGPTRTLHKPPIFYSNQCDGEYCPEVMAMCIDPKDQPRITGVACDLGKCVVRYEQGIY